MKKAFVFASKQRETVRDALRDALPLLRKHVDVEEIDLSTHEGEVEGEADFAIVFGGDGSILRVARALGPHQIPTIGVNIGKFGFLAEIVPRELESVITSLAAGAFEIVPRMMLHCRATRGEKLLKETIGLNDVVVSRGALSRLISIGLFIDDEHVTDYNGDGLIISTPVGSTAHSLAAGGPILEADLAAFAVTPICPHTLSNRPLVIPAQRSIELVVNPTRLPLALTIDGQVYAELEPADRITVRKAQQEFKLIDTGARSYYKTLREKLGWGGHPNYGNR
ncbi:MAG: NAD(+)/NADH kinase [Planctomycetes bacterium]|nr:NAD(+)/NADH kinase [Planctomycetota bacterium]